VSDSWWFQVRKFVAEKPLSQGVEAGGSGERHWSGIASQTCPS
jgi:hypothetical protein